MPWSRGRLPTPVFLGFPGSSAGQEFPCNAGNLGPIPGLGRSPGEGSGCSLQSSGLKSSMDCIVRGVGHVWETFTSLEERLLQCLRYIRSKVAVGGLFIFWATCYPRVTSPLLLTAGGAQSWRYPMGTLKGPIRDNIYPVTKTGWEEAASWACFRAAAYLSAYSPWKPWCITFKMQVCSLLTSLHML